MKVFLSPIAEEKVKTLLSFLEEEWSTKSKEEFLNKFKKAVAQISQLPYSCPKTSNSNGIYKCVVTKQSSFYYRIDSDEIEIVAFTDSRQNPERVKKWIEENFG